MLTTETTEGLDSFLSTTYYSRVRFILQLMPLLTASPTRPGHVISVYAGGFEDGTKPGDWPVGLPSAESYGVTSVRKHTCFMTNFIFEELAARHEGKLSLIHIYPGLVDGPAALGPDMPLWFRTLYRLMKPLMFFFMIKPADCGQIMVHLSSDHYAPKGVEKDASGKPTAKGSDGKVGGGSYALGATADVNHKTLMYERMRQPETAQKVWDHTMETLARAETGSAKADGSFSS